MPEVAPIVVVNATPVIALALLNQLALLQQLYQEVVIPPAVRAEVVAGGPSGIGVVDLQNAYWIQTTSLSDPRRTALLSDFDRGEAVPYLTESPPFLTHLSSGSSDVRSAEMSIVPFTPSLATKASEWCWFAPYGVGHVGHGILVLRF